MPAKKKGKYLKKNRKYKKIEYSQNYMLNLYIMVIVSFEIKSRIYWKRLWENVKNGKK